MKRRIKRQDHLLQSEYLFFSSQDKDISEDKAEEHCQNSEHASAGHDSHPHSHIQSQSQDRPQIQEIQPEEHRRPKRTRTKKKVAQKQNQRRKIRKTISKQMLDQMKERFSLYRQQKEFLGKTTLSLKQIARILNLGYSTILHKYRQFQTSNMVKGGALLQQSNRRKYQKSKDIEEIIMQSLQQKRFYTAVELAKYITAKYHLRCTRSMVCRHLNDLCFKRQAEGEEIQEAPLGESEEETANRCAKCIIHGILEKGKKMVYFGEYTIPFQRGISLYLLLLCGSQGMSFRLEKAPATRANFKLFVKDIICQYLLENKVPVNHQWMFVTGMEEVFRGQTASYLMRQEEAKLIPVLDSVNAKLICFPTGARTLNPLHAVYQKLLTKTNECHFDYNTTQLVSFWLQTLRTQAILIVRKFELSIRRQFANE